VARSGRVAAGAGCSVGGVVLRVTADPVTGAGAVGVAAATFFLPQPTPIANVVAAATKTSP
jgi:hypothetical protein